NKAVDSLHESKSDFEICVELAPRLGIPDYSEKTEDEWVKEILEDPEGMAKYPNELDPLAEGMSVGQGETNEIPDYDTFRKKGYYKFPLKEPIVVFKEQIEDPVNNPFPTPSGKIEIYSQTLADLNNPELPPIPKYFEPWEGPADPLKNKFPLQFINSHPRHRVHSSLATIPWLMETEPQRIWINPVDAEERGINDWDNVRIFNDRGVVIIPARLTETIMPGVVFMTEGAWYNPDENGVDRGGCANVLTRDAYSPEGAFCSNTCLVQVEKA
ncbi:molybdopterin dinucleotide binding domain-containing protein, partial [Thermodesulfobacteriota bacterium]